MIKLIALDLDGTLLNSETRISAEDGRALEEAAEKGIVIVPCTGRFYRSMPEELRALPFIRYAILMNGAEIYDISEKKALYSADISSERADEVFSLLEKEPCIYDCYFDDWGWMQKSMHEKAALYAAGPKYLELLLKFRKPVENLRDYVRERGGSVQKIQCYCRKKEDRERAFEKLREKFPDMNITSSLSNNVEINAHDADKGAVMLKLCGILGIKREESMAIGDGINDITLMEKAGFSVAMGNAIQKLKDSADFITDTNDQSGVGKAIRHLMTD